MGKSSKKDGFIVQAGILAAAGIICRVIGLLYRGPLTAVIGDEGNGYYQSAYNMYVIVLMISSYSIPSAISKVISQKLSVKDYVNAHRIFKCSLYYVLVVGGIAGLVLFFGAPVLTNGPAVGVLRIFAPTIFLYGILGVLRGYFQAHGTMVQTSVSQILEQILNAAVSIGAACLLIRLGASVSGEEAQESARAVRGAMGSALGTGTGVAVALLFMWGIYRLNGRTLYKRIERDRHKPLSYGEILRMVSSVVVPFILSTAIYNLSTSLNNTLYLRLCTGIRGMAGAEAHTRYGIFSGKAVVISNIPIAISSAMASAILPGIAARAEKQDMEGAREKTAQAVKVTMLIAIPSAVGLAVLARPVTWLLFPQRASIEKASDILAALALSIVFYSLSTLTNSVLQGIGRVRTPVRNAAAALVLQTALLIPLILYTDADLYALVGAMLLYSGVMCVFNQLSVRRYLGYRQEIVRTFLIPSAAAGVMGGAAYGVYRGVSALIGADEYPSFFQDLLMLAPAVLVGAVLYFVLLILLKGVDESELRAMPKGYLIVRAAKKCHLM